MTVSMDDDDMTPADRDAVKLKRETAKEREARYQRSLASTLSSKEGRAVLFRILSNAGMFHDGLGTTPETTMVLTGKRVVAVALWDELCQASRRDVAAMILENE